MTHKSTENIYKVNKGFILQKLGNGVAIFDPESSSIHTLNETAYFIFRYLKKGLSEEEIAQEIMRKYHIHEEKARDDLLNLLKELLAKKIIVQKK